MKKLLIESIEYLNLKINSKYINNLLYYWDKLLERNKYINLISRAGENRNRFVSHIVDSLTGLLFDWPDDLGLLDLGSGAGLPGLPLKICNPGWSAILVDSKAKKAAFIQEVAQLLGLERVTVSHAYFDSRSFRPGAFEFNLITTRGFASLKETVPLVARALKPGGQYLAYKGPKGNDELAEAANLLVKNNLKLIEQKDFLLPILNIPRFLYLFQKY
jgi:16S rRNA (guanine527-N7)-methyltransferase